MLHWFQGMLVFLLSRAAASWSVGNSAHMRATLQQLYECQINGLCGQWRIVLVKQRRRDKKFSLTFSLPLGAFGITVGWRKSEWWGRNTKKGVCMGQGEVSLECCLSSLLVSLSLSLCGVHWGSVSQPCVSQPCIHPSQLSQWPHVLSAGAPCLKDHCLMTL